MKHHSLKLNVLILMGTLFLIVSSAYAETAEEYDSRGIIYAKQGNFNQAISDFTKAIKINTNFAKAYYDRGLTYQNQGNFTQAISDYAKAIKIDPNYAKAYNNRGVVYCKTKEYSKAWADIRKAEKLGYAVNPEFLKVLKQASGRDK